MAHGIGENFWLGSSEFEYDDCNGESFGIIQNVFCIKWIAKDTSTTEMSLRLGWWQWIFAFIVIIF